MADTVIAPDLRERHEQLSKQLRGSKAQQRYAQFTHELIERVSKAEQENVALRDKIERLEAVISAAEFEEFFHKDDWGVPCVYKEGFERVIASRGREA